MKRPREFNPLTSSPPVAVPAKKKLKKEETGMPKEFWDAMSGLRSFKRKKPAAKDARQRGLYLLAYDLNQNFSKAFLTCTGDEAFNMVVLNQIQYGHLTALPGGWQNLYEGLLWERPCIPFFDLDAETQYNGGILKRIDEIILTFMEFVTEFFKKSYPNNLAVQDIHCPNDWIVLDSSYPKKASIHLLLRKKGIEFQTMQDHSRFSMDLLQELRQKALIQKDKRALTLYVKKQDKNKPVELCPIADASVYSVFQLMRMFLCSKRGQDRPLLISSSFQEHSSVQECFKRNNGAFCPRPTRRLFLDCLISHVSPTFPHEKRLSYKRTKLEVPRASLTATATTTTKTTNIDVTTTTSDGKLLTVSFNPSDVRTDVPMGRGDWRAYALLSILREEPHLKRWMFSTTPTVDDFKMCPTHTRNGDLIYIVSPRNNAYCPLKGSDHSTKGKIWITVPPSGRMKLKCKSAPCHSKYNNYSKTGFLLKRMGPKQIRRLWPDKT